jgi:S-adenosylmethionine synthetase
LWDNVWRWAAHGGGAFSGKDQVKWYSAAYNTSC